MSIFDRFKKDKESVSQKSQAPKAEKASDASQVTSDKKATRQKSTAKRSGKKAASMRSALATSTILEPLVSEKAAHLADRNVLVFRVAKDANRVAVRNAFRELYHVTPVRVNIQNQRGKQVRFGRVSGVRSDWKKAMIFLPEGTHVDIFEGV